jgi:hypothetical protein
MALKKPLFFFVIGGNVQCDDFDVSGIHALGRPSYRSPFSGSIPSLKQDDYFFFLPIWKGKKMSIQTILPKRFSTEVWIGKVGWVSRSLFTFENKLRQKEP